MDEVGTNQMMLGLSNVMQPNKQVKVYCTPFLKLKTGKVGFNISSSSSGCYYYHIDTLLRFSLTYARCGRFQKLRVEWVFCLFVP